MPIDTLHRRADADTRPYRDEAGFVFRPLRIPEDTTTLHRWFIQERAAFWLMQDKTEAEVREAYEHQCEIIECREQAVPRRVDTLDVEGVIGMISAASSAQKAGTH